MRMATKCAILRFTAGPLFQPSGQAFLHQPKMTAPAWAAESLRLEHGLHGGGTVILDDGPTPTHSCRPALLQVSHDGS